MVHFFCPDRRENLAGDHVFCSGCVRNLHAFRDSRDRVQKLDLCLHHPDSSAPIRFAWLFGETQGTLAMKALIVHRFLNASGISVHRIHDWGVEGGTTRISEATTGSEHDYCALEGLKRFETGLSISRARTLKSPPPSRSHAHGNHHLGAWLSGDGAPWSSWGGGICAEGSNRTLTKQEPRRSMRFLRLQLG